MSKILLFQVIQFIQTVLIQTIQFSIDTLFSSIEPIDRALSCVTIPGQSAHGSNGNEGVLCIPQSSSLTISLFSVISGTLVVFSSPSRLGKGGQTFEVDTVNIF